MVLTASAMTRIAVSFKEHKITDIDLWAQWDQLATPTLVLRVLNQTFYRRKRQRKCSCAAQKTQIIELPGMSHAPMLMDDHQIKIVRDFILK